jgi:TolB protein
MKILLATISLLLLVSASSHAQWDNVRNIYFDTITAEFEPIRVAVDDIRPKYTTPLSTEDTSLFYWTTSVIQHDIDFYSDFELIPVDSFYLKTYEISELDLAGWERLSAQYVVKLTAELPAPNFKLEWKLFDTKSRRAIGEGEFSYNRMFWRELAHDISNQIIRALTGDPGICRTKIVYIKKIGSAKELFMSDYDGANEKQLTKTGAINISPTFAPDMETVYFTSYMAGDPALYKVDVNTGKVEKVAAFPGSVTAASVSPDGKKIACVLSRDGNHEIYVLDLQGRIIKRVTRNNAIESSPTWSPDGRFIAYSSDRTGSPQVYVSDADGIDTRRLTFQGGYNDSPVWSHRGDRITFVTRTQRGRFDLASIDTSGVDYRVLTQVGHNENPHFSPDGKHIIFSSSRLSEADIYTMDITGQNQRRLTRTGNCSNPAWGPLR